MSVFLCLLFFFGCVVAFGLGIFGKTKWAIVSFVVAMVALGIRLPSFIKQLNENEKAYNAWIAACHAKGGNVLHTREGDHCISKQFLLY